MKKIIGSFALIFIFLVVFVNSVQSVAAATRHVYTAQQYNNRSETAPTLIPTVTPSTITANVTPEARILPPVGSNAGLLVGASVLVLIIIGGVLGARLRRKH